MGSQAGQGLTGDRLPLSLSQREVWLDQLAWPDSPHLKVGGGGFLSGPFDIGVFQQALQLLVQECDTLRLIPLAVGAQRVLDQFSPVLELIDVPSGSDHELMMEQWWQVQLARRTEFDGSPPWCYAILRVNSELHGLVMQFHHLILDGWGAALILRRLSELYTLVHDGGDQQASARPDYVRFVQESNQYAASDAFARDAEYWNAQIAQLPPPLIEPRFAARRASTLPTAHTVTQTLQRGAYDEVLQQVLAQGKTMFALFLSALALYFARVAQRTEVLIGVPTLNRGGKRYLQTPGMFVGVLVLRLELLPDMTSSELLAAASNAMRGALRHPRYPLSELGRTLNMVRSGRDGLFDVLVSFEQQDHEVTFGPARRSVSRQYFPGVARYPLGVTVCEFHDTQDPKLVLEGSSCCFDKAEVPLLGERIWSLVQALAAGPEIVVHALPLIPIGEREAVLARHRMQVDWHPAPQTYIAQFEWHAARSPHAPAIVWDGGVLDYATLDRCANRLAHRLIGLGAGRDRIVAVAMVRAPELVLAVLAIAKAGAAYLPLDPDAPVARLTMVLNDSAAVALLMQDFAWVRLAPLHANAIVVSGKPAQGDDTGPVPAVMPEPGDLAYVLFTSGSTGRPKGVMIEHAALSHRLAWLAKTWAVQPCDRTALATQATFDPSLIEICLPLACGASIALVPPGRQPAAAVAEFALRHAVTIMAFVPSTLGGFLDTVTGRAELRLRVACCGGEVLSADLARRFRQQTQARLFNVYGPTEACIFATAWECDGEATQQALSIGTPVDDTTVHVLDHQLRPLPFGVCGEVYIGGSGLARGYLNQPELTSTSFVADPFRVGSRLYRSGDRGWLACDGRLHFVGRLDRQVKLRGYRVELGEIEAALASIEGVSQVAAKLVEHDGRAAIHAWVAGNVGLQGDVLQRVLRVRLPDYMVPRVIVVQTSLPTGSAGKIDYAALSSPPAQARSSATRPPRGPMERDLLALWQDVLGRQTLSVQDNFFDVGGDSLAAVSILAGAERLLGRRIPLYLLTEHPTIEQLVQVLGEPVDPHAILVPLHPVAATPLFFLAASGHGDLMRMRNLARAMDGVCQVCMLQPPETDIPVRIADLAALYAQAIVARGGGPCFVGGFSVGGVAALEVARLLQSQGNPVRGLVLLDTVFPKAVWGGTFYWRVFGWLVQHLHIQDLSLNGRRLGAMFNDRGLVGQVMAMRGYRAQAFVGPTFLFKTIGLSRWHGMLFRSWRGLLGSNLSEYRVAGLHGSIFESGNVAGLAAALGVIMRSSVAHESRPEQ